VCLFSFLTRWARQIVFFSRFALRNSPFSRGPLSPFKRAGTTFLSFSPPPHSFPCIPSTRFSPTFPPRSSFRTSFLLLALFSSAGTLKPDPGEFVSLSLLWPLVHFFCFLSVPGFMFSPPPPSAFSPSIPQSWTDFHVHLGGSLPPIEVYQRRRRIFLCYRFFRFSCVVPLFLAGTTTFLTSGWFSSS